MDEIKITGFPNNAAGYKPWINALVQAVSSAAYDEDLAFHWIMRVTQDDVSFDELGNAGDERSLDSKLRTALTKYTTGDSYDKHRCLVDLLL